MGQCPVVSVKYLQLTAVELPEDDWLAVAAFNLLDKFAELSLVFVSVPVFLVSEIDTGQRNTAKRTPGDIRIEYPVAVLFRKVILKLFKYGFGGS
jgi:hypothetical protein